MANKRRITKKRNLKPKIHISSEGAVTEIDYLKILNTLFPLDTYTIDIIGQRKNLSDPLNILDNHKKQVKKSTYTKNDIEVIIIDREENNNRTINQIRPLIEWRNADRSRRILIINSTCFEYWLLCHFVDNPSCKTTKQINESLKKKWPDYKKSLRKRISRDQVIKASDRAKKLASFEQMVNSEICGSNMYELIDLLLELEDKESR